MQRWLEWMDEGARQESSKAKMLRMQIKEAPKNRMIGRCPENPPENVRCRRAEGGGSLNKSKSRHRSGKAGQTNEVSKTYGQTKGTPPTNLKISKYKNSDFLNFSSRFLKRFKNLSALRAKSQSHLKSRFVFPQQGNFWILFLKNFCSFFRNFKF